MAFRKKEKLVGSVTEETLTIAVAPPVAAADVGDTMAPVSATPAIVAHRGSGGTTAENTIVSFQQAKLSGATCLEIDVQLSADGVPFLFHDSTGTRTTDVAQVFPERATDPITSFTWNELSQLDAGSFFSSEFADQTIPHLRDVARTHGRDAHINIEMKSPKNSPGIEQVLADELTNQRIWQRLVARNLIVVSSFDASALRTFHELAPNIPLLQIGDIPVTDIELASWTEFTTGVVTDYRAIDTVDVERVHNSGLTLSVYTVNSPDSMQQMISAGVDAIITDFPAVLRNVIQGQPPVPQANGIVIADVVPDIPGSDLQPETGEHVVLTNTSDRAIDVSGYLIQDAVISRLAVGAGYILAPGGELRVYSGPGTNTSDKYYNDYGRNILNDDGDSLAVLTPSPHLVLVDLYAY